MLPRVFNSCASRNSVFFIEMDFVSLKKSNCEKRLLLQWPAADIVTLLVFFTQSVFSFVEN